MIFMRTTDYDRWMMMIDIHWRLLITCFRPSVFDSHWRLHCQHPQNHWRWHDRTLPIAPISITESMCFRPLVIPRNTRLLDSQARFDRPRTRFCFGPCCRGNDYGNHSLQPDKEPDRTTHFTIPTWFSFFRVNNHFSFRKARNRKNKSVQLFLVWDTMKGRLIFPEPRLNCKNSRLIVQRD